MDREGKTVDFLLTAKRDVVAAYRFLLKAVADTFVGDIPSTHQPIEIRQVKYLNNIARKTLAGIGVVHLLLKNSMRTRQK